MTQQLYKIGSYEGCHLNRVQELHQKCKHVVLHMTQFKDEEGNEYELVKCDDCKALLSFNCKCKLAKWNANGTSMKCPGCGIECM